MYETYLINLDRSHDRLETMQHEFDKHQITYQRISAVDARELDKHTFRLRNKYNRNLVPGEIGCYLSHVKALQTFLASDNLFALIIEDDAVLCNDFKRIIEEYLSAYNQLPEKNKWDVLKLYNGKRRHIKIAQVTADYILAACGTSIPITTLAAVWTRKGAEKFLNKVANPLPVVSRPIDCELQHAWEFDLLIYNALPSLVRSAGFKTEIHSEGKTRKSVMSRRIIYELNRVFAKHYYHISRHGIKKYFESFIAKKNPILP